MSAASQPPPADMPVSIGDVLAGKYQVERVLGIGGMGVVVAARHLQLEQTVALKFLQPQAMQSEEAVSRFQREARSAVRLRSENVAKVIDVGVLDNGAPYMVMEFLEGADLSQVVKATGSITIEEAVAFVLQACEAIAEAHSIGIIHRDLKPQNLFVTRRVDGRPLIKVLDFGISKSLDPNSKNMSLTRTSSIMGSPLYMSPEQMRSTKNVDQRSDIWSLGVILYELLTGRVPFEGESVPELCLKVVQDPLVPPKTLRDEISEGLSAAVCKCLEKDAAMRFQNVADLAAALEPHSTTSQGASDRIAGTLNVPSRPPMVSISSTGSHPRVRTAGTAWGATQAIAARKRRIPFIAGGAIVVAAGVTFAVLSNSKAPAPASAAPVVASSTPEHPTASTTATAPPTAVQTATVSVVPSTSTAPTSAPPAPPPTFQRSSSVRPSGATSKSQTGTSKSAPPAVTAPPKKFE